MKKVAIMGMGNHTNLGDQIITQNVAFLVGCVDGIDYKCVNFIDELSGKRYEKYNKIRKKLTSNKKIYQLMKIYVWQTYERELRDCDAIIIACGSFKYKTQFLWASYCIILEYARLYNIPVMFNAMNIQEFDESDWRSCMLKSHINNGCVKVFTTRDGEEGVNRLKKDYIESDIRIAAVGDPAFWVKETYNYCISGTKKIRVGINLIRPDIFEDYNGGVSCEQVIKFYKNLLLTLDEKNIQWCLFTNGMKVDEKIIKDLLGEISDGRLFLPKTTEDLIGFIDSCEMIVGARLHACIVAYALKVPFAGFYWDDKLVRFAEDNELAESFCNAIDFTAQSMIAKLKKSLNRVNDRVVFEKWKKRTYDEIENFVKYMI